MSDQYDVLIRRYTELYMHGQDWRLVKAQVRQESNFQEDAISPVGAKGLMQIMPKTWLDIHPFINVPNKRISDPEANIAAGCYYMNRMIRVWYWDRPEIDRYMLALASYNAGSGNIIKAQRASGNERGYSQIIQHLPQVTGKHANETINYVRRIMQYYLEYIGV